MKIFGHPWIAHEPFYPIRTIEDIEHTPPNSSLLLGTLSSSIELVNYCHQNHIPYLLMIENIKDALFANQLGCRYLIANKALAKELMPIAQNYLFDTQVLATIESEEEIEALATFGIDGVIFRHLIPQSSPSP